LTSHATPHAKGGDTICAKLDNGSLKFNRAVLIIIDLYTHEKSNVKAR
jgi:hypothetical protein